MAWPRGDGIWTVLSWPCKPGWGQTWHGKRRSILPLYRACFKDASAAGLGDRAHSRHYRRRKDLKPNARWAAPVSSCTRPLACWWIRSPNRGGEEGYLARHSASLTGPPARQCRSSRRRTVRMGGGSCRRRRAGEMFRSIPQHLLHADKNELVNPIGNATRLRNTADN